MIKCFVFPVFLAVLFTGVSAIAQQNTVTIAVVNNADMIRLKKLAGKMSVDQVLRDSQAAVNRAVKAAGYEK